MPTTMSEIRNHKESRVEKNTSERSEERIERKPWQTPELTPHPVVKLTRGTFNPGGTDFGVYS